MPAAGKPSLASLKKPPNPKGHSTTPLGARRNLWGPVYLFSLKRRLRDPASLAPGHCWGTGSARAARLCRAEARFRLARPRGSDYRNGMERGPFPFSLSEPGEEFTWLGRRFERGSAVRLDLGALSVGLGYVEHIRVYRRQRGELCAFRLPDHLQRAQATARVLLADLDAPLEALEAGCVELLRALASPGLLSLYFLPTLSVAQESAPGLSVVARFTPRSQPAFGLDQPAEVPALRATLSAYDAAPQRCVYGPGNVFAQRFGLHMSQLLARRSGYDVALRCDERGYPLDSALGNLFCVEGYRVITPPLAAGGLAEMARQSVMVLAEESGLLLEESNITRDRLLRCDEACVVSTQGGIQSVIEVDGVVLGSGKVGSLCQRLAERYRAVTTGTDTNHPEWLYPIT